MSRVGKQPVKIPPGVEIALDPESIRVKGGKGELGMRLSAYISVAHEKDQLTVTPKSNDRRARAMWGTTRARIANLVKGVYEGFTRRLEITGVGYRAAIEGNMLRLQLGYSHDVHFPIPAGIGITCPIPTQIVITGADCVMVGQTAAKIRAWRKPEPYKGKGIRYEGEIIRRKEGKKK